MVDSDASPKALALVFVVALGFAAAELGAPNQGASHKDRYLSVSAVSPHPVAPNCSFLIMAALGEAPAQAISALGNLFRRRRSRDVAYLEVAADNADFGLWFWDPSERQVWMNPYCRRVIGLGEHMTAELDVFTQSLAGARAHLARDAMVHAVLSSGNFQREFEVKGADGRALWLLATGRCITAENGACVTGTLQNITEQKAADLEVSQLRRQVIHLTRVSTLGELSGALAHELNQPLTAILSNAQAGQRLLDREIPDAAEIREILGDIVEDDRRAGAVITKLRNLIRNEDVDFSEIDLNQIVIEVSTLVHSELIERRIAMTIEAAPHLPTVRGDRIQILQVLLNLIRNACDAMAAARGYPCSLVISTAQRDGMSVVTVADNGPGVPEEIRENLFEPFATTKSVGMGLGLAISRAILSAHGGLIWCDSGSTGGAVFSFSLPSSEGRKIWNS